MHSGFGIGIRTYGTNESDMRTKLGGGHCLVCALAPG